MFTVVKIREGLKRYDENPGWYDYPDRTVADRVDGPPSEPAKKEQEHDGPNR